MSLIFICRVWLLEGISNAECSGNLKVPLTGWKYDDICNHMGDVRLLQEIWLNSWSVFFEEVLGYHAQPIFKKTQFFFLSPKRIQKSQMYAMVIPWYPQLPYRAWVLFDVIERLLGEEREAAIEVLQIWWMHFFWFELQVLVFWLIFVYFFPKQCVHSRSLRIAPYCPFLWCPSCTLAWPKLSSTGVFFPSVYLHFTIELKQYSSSMKQWYNVVQYY